MASADYSQKISFLSWFKSAAGINPSCVYTYLGPAVGKVDAILSVGGVSIASLVLAEVGSGVRVGDSVGVLVAGRGVLVGDGGGPGVTGVGGGGRGNEEGEGEEALHGDVLGMMLRWN